jgi:hypothetical protein
MKVEMVCIALGLIEHVYFLGCPRIKESARKQKGGRIKG